jgi:hypothetical protein
LGCTQQEVMELQLASGINAPRMGQYPAPLPVDPALSAVARMRAQDMASKGCFGLDPPDGCNYQCLLERQGIPVAWTGETIAWNTYRSGRSAVASVQMGRTVQPITPSSRVVISLVCVPEQHPARMVGASTWQYSKEMKMAVRLRVFRRLDMGLRETYSRHRISPASDGIAMLSSTREWLCLSPLRQVASYLNFCKDFVSTLPLKATGVFDIFARKGKMPARRLETEATIKIV